MTSHTDTATLESAGLSEAFARWKKTVEAELKGAPFDKKLVTRSFEGIALQPLYTRADLAGNASLQSRPGEAPYVRGVRARGYRDGAWEVAQEISAATPAAFNAAVLADLQRGQNSVALQVGNEAGLPLQTMSELATALAGVDLTAIPVHIRTGSDPLPLAAAYLALARDRGIAWDRLNGSVAADPLTDWAEGGQLPAKLDDMYSSLAGWTTWASTHAPALKTIEVDASLWGDAGGTAVQELAFAIAAAAEYVRALQKAGVSPETTAGRLRFRFAAGPQFFMEVAKFRALRPLWTRVLTAFGAPASAAAKASLHVVTAGWNKTLLDPHVNMLRATTEALSAVLGGCDSLHVAPFDQVAGATDDFSRRIARNVHALLAEEFGFAQVADPAGGSWYVEKLTDDLARQAWSLFQQIEARGGFAAALQANFPQELITKAMGEKADAIAKRRYALIGTNQFPNLKEKPLIAATAQPRPARAGSPAALPEQGSWAARFEAALVAVRTGAALDALRKNGGSSPVNRVARWRASAAFEALRTASGAFAQRTGARPKVFLAKMGPVLQHKARADFSAGFFAVGGFEALGKQAFELPEAAAQAAAASGAQVAVLCSTDDTYPILAPAFARAAKAANPNLIVVLAGLPADAAQTAAFREAGFDEFIHIRANVHEILSTFLAKIGARA